MQQQIIDLLKKHPEGLDLNEIARALNAKRRTDILTYLTQMEWDMVLDYEMCEEPYEEECTVKIVKKYKLR